MISATKGKKGVEKCPLTFCIGISIKPRDVRTQGANKPIISRKLAKRQQQKSEPNNKGEAKRGSLKQSSSPRVSSQSTAAPEARDRRALASRLERSESESPSSRYLEIRSSSSVFICACSKVYRVRGGGSRLLQ
eukprot:scaffold3740_cov51-Cyclotella_meneghiniana.AAC.17